MGAAAGGSSAQRPGMAMQLPLVDPTDPPNPPEETRVREVRAEPYPDGPQLRLHVRLPPFQQRPDIDITVFNKEGDVIASSTVVEALRPALSLTMHLPPEAGFGACSARLLLRYPEIDRADERHVGFSMRETSSWRQETDAGEG